MSRKQFIQSHGATCNNWRTSWSFVNEAEKFVIFGAWDRHTTGENTLILAKEWKVNGRGNKNPGYKQSREHIRLVEENQYRLMTFPLKHSTANAGKDGLGPWTIKEFTPTLSPKKLIRVGDSWYASDGKLPTRMTEEVFPAKDFYEGAKTTVTVNAYERDPKARTACIEHHGLSCAVCGFNFQAVYGSLGEGFIHVHHLKPLHEIGARYKVDPIKDLAPVCPNCHAMIHRSEPPLDVEQLRTSLEKVQKDGVS